MTQNPQYDRLLALAATHGLQDLGCSDADGGTIVLLGPAADFWAILTASREWADGQADAVDRWSTRVIGELADTVGGQAHFPFGGPPWAPFLHWAVDSGAAASSPVGMLVHERLGLFVSFRGAVWLPEPMPPTARPARPCDNCSAPCTTACPVDALTADGYDTQACKAYLRTEAGQDCLTRGCAVRRACPVGAGLRAEAQSAYHMRIFLTGA